MITDRIDRHSSHEYPQADELIKRLRDLTDVPSVSGNEPGFALFLLDEVRKFSDNVYIDAVGNVIARKGNPDTFIFVHMDTIGFIVSSKTDLGVRAVSVKEKGARPTDRTWGVQILMETGSVTGTISKVADKDVLRVKISKKDSSSVKVGDFAALTPNLERINQNTVKSQGLDNKLGLLTAIEAFKNASDIGLVVTVQEETTGRGATKAVWDLKPNAVIILDTTYDESDEGILGPVIGGGPSICLKDSLFPDRTLTEALIKAGRRSEVPIQFEVLESGASDANRVHTAWGYTPFVFLGIPIKNMHSPNEIGDIRDVESTVKLLTEFFKGKALK